MDKSEVQERRLQTANYKCKKRVAGGIRDLMNKGLRRQIIIAIPLRQWVSGGIRDLMNKGLRLFYCRHRAIDFYFGGIRDLMNKGLRLLKKKLPPSTSWTTGGIRDLMNKGLRLNDALISRKRDVLKLAEFET